MKNENQPINPTNVQQVGNEVFRPIRDNDPKEHNVSFLGLTKREYFAGLAMQGLLANEKCTKNKSNIFIRFLQLFYPEMNIKWSSSNTDDLTISAIKYADELLLQLDKPISTTEA